MWIVRPSPQGTGPDDAFPKTSVAIFGAAVLLAVEVPTAAAVVGSVLLLPVVCVPRTPTIGGQAVQRAGQQSEGPGSFLQRRWTGVGQQGGRPAVGGFYRPDAGSRQPRRMFVLFLRVTVPLLVVVAVVIMLLLGDPKGIPSPDRLTTAEGELLM